MNKIIKTTLVIGVLTILLGLGLDSTVLSEAEANGGEDFTVIELKGDPEFVVSVDFNDPKIVLTISATTSEGPVTIVQTVEDYTKDILLGCTIPNSDPCGAGDPESRDGEHLLITGEWNFEGGNTLHTDTRTYISEVSVTNCGEFINNLNRSVIRGGTGRFADAKGYIEMDLDEFCFDAVPAIDDPNGKPVKLKKQGSFIDGLIVLP